MANAKNVPLYSREELKAESGALFGVSAEVLAGALSQCEKESLSIEETKSKIDLFLNGKVV